MHLLSPLLLMLLLASEAFVTAAEDGALKLSHQKGDNLDSQGILEPVLSFI